MNANTTAMISSARGGRPHRRPRERSSPDGAADGPPFQAAEDAQDDMSGSPHVNVNNINMRGRETALKDRRSKNSRSPGPGSSAPRAPARRLRRGRLRGPLHQ